jgi:hypothetical protein
MTAQQEGEDDDAEKSEKRRPKRGGDDDGEDGEDEEKCKPHKKRAEEDDDNTVEAIKREFKEGMKKQINRDFIDEVEKEGGFNPCKWLANGGEADIPEHVDTSEVTEQDIDDVNDLCNNTEKGDEERTKMILEVNGFTDEDIEGLKNVRDEEAEAATQ